MITIKIYTWEEMNSAHRYKAYMMSSLGVSMEDFCDLNENYKLYYTGEGVDVTIDYNIEKANG